MGFIDDLINKTLKVTNEGANTLKENLKNGRVKGYLEEIKKEVELCFGIPVEEKSYTNIMNMFLNKKASEDGYWDENVDKLLKNLILFSITNIRKEETYKKEYLEDLTAEQINNLVMSIDVNYILNVINQRKTDVKSFLLFLAGIERNNSIEDEEKAVMLGVGKDSYLQHLSGDKYSLTYVRKLNLEYPNTYYMLNEGIHPNIQKEFYNFVKKRSEETVNAIFAVLGKKLSEMKERQEKEQEETKENGI